METTPRLNLALLAAGQVNKELFHNEALLALDLLVGGTVEVGFLTVPPASPLAETLYLIGPSASDDWTGHDGELAAFTSNGWRFFKPSAGMRFTERLSGLEWRFDGGDWEVGTARASRLIVDGHQVVGERCAAIANPSGGANVDLEARNCLASVLNALRGHGLIGT